MGFKFTQFHCIDVFKLNSLDAATPSWRKSLRIGKVDSLSLKMGLCVGAPKDFIVPIGRQGTRAKKKA